MLGRVLFLLLLSITLTVAVVSGRSAPGETERLNPVKHSSHAMTKRDKTPRMQVLDEDARIFLFENFLTEEECDHLVNLAQDHLQRSGVVSNKKGESSVSDVRTSRGTFLRRGQDEWVQEIERRIARWTLLPVGNGEGLQILRYDKSQKYDGHFDYFFDEQNGEKNGGNRFATVLMYLNTVEEGGETVFPNIPAPNGDNGPDYSACARHHLAAKPRKGDAVLFHSIKPNGELERRSLHTACPVIKGVKWSAPKWIHVGHVSSGDEAPVSVKQHLNKVLGENGCGDNHVKCAEWAEQGECQKNASFMVGDSLNPGECLFSCNRCDILRNAGGKKSYIH
ncbi:hypothetical protein M9434_005726 [Picochlorum sp. BPE23]|nr:hypothetical protein M9434_005726 [Picochlorum sp. BPE23]